MTNDASYQMTEANATFPSKEERKEIAETAVRQSFDKPIYYPQPKHSEKGWQYSFTDFSDIHHFDLVIVRLLIVAVLVMLLLFLNSRMAMGDTQSVVAAKVAFVIVGVITIVYGWKTYHIIREKKLFKIGKTEQFSGEVKQKLVFSRENLPVIRFLGNLLNGKTSPFTFPSLALYLIKVKGSSKKIKVSRSIFHLVEKGDIVDGSVFYCSRIPTKMKITTPTERALPTRRDLIKKEWRAIWYSSYYYLLRGVFWLGVVIASVVILVEMFSY